MNVQRELDEKCKSKAERGEGPRAKSKPDESGKERVRDTETDTEMVAEGAVSRSVDRSPEVVIYSIVSISQQQLQPSFFISHHSLRKERYFCPSEPNRHSR